MNTLDSFNALRSFQSGDERIQYFSLKAADDAGAGSLMALPYSLKILAENLLRHEDGRHSNADDIRALGEWPADRRSTRQIAYRPARVIMPDASATPLLADLCAMRDALKRLGGEVSRINPQTPIDLIIDHSAIVEVAGRKNALAQNMRIEFERNKERFAFLKWSAMAYRNINLIPPGNGIMHQVNLEYLGQVVRRGRFGDNEVAFPDSLIGMDSHTTMINALGILGWGVGGIEAGAAMLGQPVGMLLPEVVGCRLTGELPAGCTATDLVLRVTEVLREHDVVQKFVEFCGDGVESLSLAQRATLSNMAPEYGATVGFFAVDDETLSYLRTTGRSEQQIELVERYTKINGMFRTRGAAEPAFTELVEIDLGTIEPCMAGPSRPNQRTPLAEVPQSFERELQRQGRDSEEMDHGAVAIAAITSCTNTSNPALMIAAGLVARKARALGLRPKPWVKTSLAPGSRAVGHYLKAAGLDVDLDALGFQVVGYGCMTCMGASGDIDEGLAQAVTERGLVAGAVLSGNRNFEGRIHPHCRANYLASPPLVVAYALAGSLKIDISREALGVSETGEKLYLKDVWPDPAEVDAVMSEVVNPRSFTESYAAIGRGDSDWEQLQSVSSETFAWEHSSSYLRRPPYFDELDKQPAPIRNILGARILVMAGDMTTTDHISPVSVISSESDAGQYLISAAVNPADFNNYMTRRANHEVMIRGTFANSRFRNELALGTEGSVTRHFPSGDQMSVFRAAERYRSEHTPLLVVAGKEYGTGSSRDWAAKGTYLLGIRAVLAESFERIHRSNLVGMGVIPLQFSESVSRESLELDGSERFDIFGLDAELRPGQGIACHIHRVDGSVSEITLLSRLDTAVEVDYYKSGGMLHFALRQALG